MIHQTVYDTSEICFQLGVRHAVFSPGSRNAALSVSFHRNPKIETRVIVDERSAGFIALGIAQQTGTPVVLCCTSGTSLLNYGPAIAEAWYQHIPLIVLSADRPPEWIDQWDGQTIRQEHVFQKFTKANFQMPTSIDHTDSKWHYVRNLTDGIQLAQAGRQGPVHINIPFREPFYPEKNQELKFSNFSSLTKMTSGEPKLPSADLFNLKEEFESCKRVLLVLGQNRYNPQFSETLHGLNAIRVPIVADVTSNQQSDITIRHQDIFLQQRSVWKELKPDLVISIGKSLISKNLKLFVRDSGAKHWFIDPVPGRENPLVSLNRSIGADPVDVLEWLSTSAPKGRSFYQKWHASDTKVKKQLAIISERPYAEFTAFHRVIQELPASVDLHLANSMPVRYANFLGIRDSSTEIFCNRGTSGIDGSNGTAVGHALTTRRKTVLLSGDLSFLYDQNAFFHEYDLSNLYIIVFNNFGGGIFDLIPGPMSLPDDERILHFNTRHNRDMKGIAADAGFSYFKANDLVTLELSLSEFFKESDKPRLLEIQTDPKQNQQVFFEIKRTINE